MRRYLSNEAVRAQILEYMDSQGIDVQELAEILEMPEDDVMKFFSREHDFSVSEINMILMELDLEMRFEIVPF